MAPKSASMVCTFSVLIRFLRIKEVSSANWPRLISFLKSLIPWIWCFILEASHQNKEIWRQGAVLSNTSWQGYLFCVNIIVKNRALSITGKVWTQRFILSPKLNFDRVCWITGHSTVSKAFLKSSWSKMPGTSVIWFAQECHWSI